MPKIPNAKPIDSPRCDARLPEAALRYRRTANPPLITCEALGAINVTAWLYRDRNGVEGIQVNPNITIAELNRVFGPASTPDAKVGFHSEGYDGKKYRGPADWHTDYSFRKIDNNTVEEKDWLEGKDELRETDVYTISADGKTLTQKITFPTTKDGKTPPPLTRLFSRDGDNPHSSDPFVGYWVEDHTKISPREEFTVELVGDSTIEALLANGASWRFTFDGKDHPPHGNPGCETFNAQFIDSRTAVRKCINAGRLTWTATDRFSDDWKTHSTVVADANGKSGPARSLTA